MKSLERYLSNVHPVLKLGLYIQLLCLAIWGPFTSSILITILCFVFLVFYSGEKGIVANPYYALLFCTIAVLIVIPGGSREDILYASELSVRIFNIMLISAILGLLMKLDDVLLIGRLSCLPEEIFVVVIAMVLFLPAAKRTIQSVSFAQRSRGLELGFFSLFRLSTYRALIIPYVICVLRNALASWVSMNLRPWSRYKQAVGRIKVAEVILFLFSFALWVH